ncbi:MAG TPA: phosphate ABC transporter substrate-binding protein PstS [Candidatus Margulisbacteria bacterium]|nr:MAG: phosphate ABC transporter substrate-binding protein PstS [Candidatus Margulisbacteria bacterium GWD2_39_127]OGI06197.1 MAG: phosphate ABC transporter substrate-binding protein PstS [Candidatus Margulisbacteria bacterium GWE2_39_32]HAR64569.1 phosphate ABC transporter substrate-binding protein PstS [Candidatus Margulisiibacteriota bacterium]HCT84608.1 phosphate ABC transporter substrate-binding protein PstS [Candidatus Margulisiibacteriota bacterium]
MKKIIIGLLGVVMMASASFAAGNNELLGAGATFPYPLYAKMFDVYNKEKEIKVNYQAIGSGGGIRQLTSMTVDFGASDAYLTDMEMLDMPAKTLHIPTCLGGVTLIYNLPGNPELKFTPELIADIFLGNIKNWNDKRIAKVNPGVQLPSFPLVVVHRSDGSGTTSIFTDYLTKVSKEWKTEVGAGKAVGWPCGLGGKGNSGVAGLVKQTQGSFGYVEYSYALQNKMPIPAIKNSSGVFVEPSIESVSAAAEGSIPADTRVSITNTSAKNGYPIAGFTWLLVYQDQNYKGKSMEEAQNLVGLLTWMTHEGQQYAKPLDYSPLSAGAVKKVEEIISSIKYAGKKVL